MSVVTVTDLTPGVQPASADVNATLTSWNSATAAGQINGANVAVEGIDRRTLSATTHAIYATGGSGVTTLRRGGVAAVGPAGVPTQIANMVIGNFNTSAALFCLVHLNAVISSSAGAATITLDLYQDTGAGYLAIAAAFRRFTLRNTNAGSVLRRSITITAPFSTSAAVNLAPYYTCTAAATTITGTIFVEILNK